MNERDEELWVQANQLCHSQNVIKKFAELVRADEREACAKEIAKLRKALSIIFANAKDKADSEWCSDAAFNALKEVE